MRCRYTWASVYVNDFDFNNRSYRVYLQADQKFRAEAKDMRSYYVRSDTNRMIPLDDVVDIQQTTSPQVISHFNLFRSAGNRRFGRARIEHRTGPDGYGIAGEETAAQGHDVRLERIIVGRNTVQRQSGNSVWIRNGFPCT